METHTSKHWLPVVYGAPAEWEEKIYHCLVCDESGDFSGENDTIVESALEIAKKQSVVSMLDALCDGGIKMTYLERSLELPPKTVARWKNGGCSAASIALLRIIRTFPWLLEVADANYDKKVALNFMFQEVSTAFSNVISASTKSVTTSMSIDGDKVDIFASLELHSGDYILSRPVLHNLAANGD